MVQELCIKSVFVVQSLKNVSFKLIFLSILIGRKGNEGEGDPEFEKQVKLKGFVPTLSFSCMMWFTP